jgi:hypothetical protein
LNILLLLVVVVADMHMEVVAVVQVAIEQDQ